MRRGKRAGGESRHSMRRKNVLALRDSQVLLRQGLNCYVFGGPYVEQLRAHRESRFNQLRIGNMAKAAAATQVVISLKNLAAEIAEKHELPKKQAETILNEVVASIGKQLKKGSKIRIAGLGILQVRKRAARMGRNPQTGEAIKIKASKKIAFRAAKELKESV
jgi:DNA-binding protein HU-beta